MEKTESAITVGRRNAGYIASPGGEPIGGMLLELTAARFDVWRNKEESDASLRDRLVAAVELEFLKDRDSENAG